MCWFSKRGADWISDGSKSSSGGGSDINKGGGGGRVFLFGAGRNGQLIDAGKGFLSSKFSKCSADFVD